MSFLKVQYCFLEVAFLVMKRRKMSLVGHELFLVFFPLLSVELQLSPGNRELHRVNGLNATFVLDTKTMLTSEVVLYSQVALWLVFNYKKRLIWQFQGSKLD